MTEKTGVRDLDVTGVYDGWIDDLDRRDGDYIPENIGLSRLGLCVRQTCLIMSNAAKKEISLEENENKKRMWRVAKLIEEDYRKAYTDKRVLFSYQGKVSDWLPEGWGGFFDFLLLKNKEFALIEMKATHSNNFRYASELPKEHNVLQAIGYCYGCRNGGITVDHYKVLYVDRGGQNRPLAFSFEYGDDDEKRLLAEMNRQMLAWLECKKSGIYPEPIDRVIEIKLDKKKKIYEGFLAPSWACLYCDFCGASCLPETSKNKVGEYAEGKIKMRKEYTQYEQDVENLLKSEGIIK